MISRSYWLSLPIETRQRLAIALEVPRTGSCEVFGSQILSDGYTDKDLSHINLETLKDFMREPDNDNFYQMLDVLIDRLTNPITVENPVVEEKEKPSLEEDIELLKKQVAELNPTNKVLYNTVMPEQVIKTIPKIKAGRPKGSKNK